MKNRTNSGKAHDGQASHSPDGKKSSLHQRPGPDGRCGGRNSSAIAIAKTSLAAKRARFPEIIGRDSYFSSNFSHRFIARCNASPFKSTSPAL